MIKIFRNALMAALLCVVSAAVTGCIEDGVTTSPSDQPVFSVDTLKLGTVFTEEVTTTHRFTVHNRAKKGIIISDIRMSGEHGKLFRLNVDGQTGREFSNVEIRANDSIYVLVEATLPANKEDLPVEVAAKIDFVTNGVTSHVTVTANGQDVERLKALTLNEDTRFSATKPYQIFDSLVVAEGRTLTLPAGARLYFHDGATMIVRGTLLSEGTVDQPVTLCGDRTGNVVTDISFDLMSRQWNGLQFTVLSHGNVLNHTVVKNSWFGVIVSGDGSDLGAPKLSMLNSRLRNSGDLVLEVYDADIRAVGCEFGEAANGLVRLTGGSHVFNQCTFANYYLFSALGGPALQFAHLNAEDDSKLEEPLTTPYTRAEFTNCIVYGNGTDLSHGTLDDTEVYFRRCLLKSAGTDDDHLLNCLWDTDPLYYTVREDYVFDYRLRDESPAIGAANASLNLPEAAVDGYGLQRGSTPDLGAYVYTPGENKD